MASFDISSILKQLDFGSSSKSDKDAAIKELVSDGTNLAGSIYNKDTDKLPKEILKLAKTAASLFDLGTNNASEASQEVSKQNQEISAANSKSNEIFNSVNERLQSILNNCENTETSIRAALEEIQALGGNIEELQAKLEEKVAELDKQKEVLNNENATPAERKEAIATILKISSEIDGLFAEVTEYQSKLEAQQNVATEGNENLEAQNTELDNVINDGSQEITEVTEETAEIAENAGTMQANAVKDQLTGGKKIAIGTAMTSGPQAIISGSTGAQYIASGTDDEAAGGIRQAGAATGFAQTTTLLGSILTKVGEFANSANAIGQYTSELANVIGSFNSTIEPMITSIGSWEAISSANEELKSYTTEYASEIGMSDEEIESLVSNNENNRNNETSESKEESNLTYKEFTFDTNTFKDAFKIKK